MSVQRRIKTVVIGMATLLACASGAQAETIIKISAEDPGGCWYSYSAIFARIIEQATKGEIRSEIVPRGGGIANPSIVNLHKSDFGFTTSNAAACARDGLEDVYKGKKITTYSADVLPDGSSFDPTIHGHWSRQVGNLPLITVFVKG